MSLSGNAALRSLSSLFKGREETAEEAVTRRYSNLRGSERFGFSGPAIPMRVRDKKSTVQLKDLSCGGASGIMEEPVSVGDTIIIELDAKTHVSAEVRWIRRVLVGVRFTEPVAQALVNKLYQKHRG